MQDKQIINDGIDVSGCEFAVKPINDNRIKCHCAKGLLQIAKMQEQPESIKSGLCENNPNCYYKQLKRKEQECEELKQQLERKEENYQKLLSKSNKYIHNLVDENVQDISNLARQLDQLKKTNEELKKENNLFRTCHDHEQTKRRKYEQAIEDIKKIAEECYYKCNSMNNCNISCRYYNNCNGEFSYLLAYLNKQISEVEDKC